MAAEFERDPVWTGALFDSAEPVLSAASSVSDAGFCASASGALPSGLHVVALALSDGARVFALGSTAWSAPLRASGEPLVLVGEGSSLSFTAALGLLRGGFDALVSSRFFPVDDPVGDGRECRVQSASECAAAAARSLATLARFRDSALAVPDHVRPCVVWPVGPALDGLVCAPRLPAATPVPPSVFVARVDARSRDDLLRWTRRHLLFQCPHTNSDGGTARLVRDFFAAAANVQTPGSLCVVGLVGSRRYSEHYGLVVRADAGASFAGTGGDCGALGQSASAARGGAFEPMGRFASPHRAYRFVGLDAVLPLELVARGYQHESCAAARGTSMREASIGSYLMVGFVRVSVEAHADADADSMADANV